MLDTVKISTIMKNVYKEFLTHIGAYKKANNIRKRTESRKEFQMAASFNNLIMN